MNHHAYQWRPIRGRRFDSWRLLGAAIVTGTGTGTVIALAWIVGLLLPLADRYLP